MKPSKTVADLSKCSICEDHFPSEMIEVDRDEFSTARCPDCMVDKFHPKQNKHLGDSYREFTWIWESEMDRDGETLPCEVCFQEKPWRAVEVALDHNLTMWCTDCLARVY